MTAHNCLGVNESAFIGKGQKLIIFRRICYDRLFTKNVLSVLQKKLALRKVAGVRRGYIHSVGKAVARQSVYIGAKALKALLFGKCSALFGGTRINGPEFIASCFTRGG